MAARQAYRKSVSDALGIEYGLSLIFDLRARTFELTPGRGGNADFDEFGKISSALSANSITGWAGK
jgi:hypothetical protein